MKLQLWTTVDGEPDDLLGEIDVDDDEWHDAQADAGRALELVQSLASELGSECDTGPAEPTYGDMAW